MATRALLLLTCALIVGPQYVAADWTWPSWVPWSSQTTTTSSSSSTSPPTTTTTTSGSQGSRKSLNPGTTTSAATLSPSPSTNPVSPTPSSPAPTNAIPVAGGSTGGLSGASDYVTPHNKARSSYGAGALTRNSTLEAFAQKLVNKCVFAHSGGPYGENLYAASGSASLLTWQKAVDMWMSESSKYNPAAPNYQVDGHFTQVVWKSSTQVGCALKACPSGQTIFACDYYPRGNVQGRYADNVGTLQG